MKLGVQVDLGPGHIVFDGDPAPPPLKGHSPQFSAHICCGHKAGWTKTALGTEVGLGPGHVVLDGPQLPSPKRGRSPSIFGPCLFRPNGWMHQDATRHRARPQPRRLCVIWGPSLLPKKGVEHPNFQPISIVAKRLNGSRWHLVYRWALVQATLC